MKILLSPSKSFSLRQATNDVLFHSQASFLKESKLLISKLRKMNVQNIQTMMHLSKDLAELNEFRFKNWENPLEPTEEVLQAVFAFNGEVYKGFDVSSLTVDELYKAQESVRILSGLYGILKPMDLVYPYRLEMGTRWAVNSKYQNLYQFWGKKLTQFLNNELKSDESVINLASTEYSKAVNQKELKTQLITPVFKEYKNGKYSVVMVYAKNARGKMARYIVQNNITVPAQLKLYTLDGYSFDYSQSNELEWVFIR